MRVVDDQHLYRVPTAAAMENADGRCPLVLYFWLPHLSCSVSRLDFFYFFQLTFSADHFASNAHTHKGLFFLYQLMYLYDHTSFYTPFLHLQRLEVKRLTLEDQVSIYGPNNNNEEEDTHTFFFLFYVTRGLL